MTNAASNSPAKPETSTETSTETRQIVLKDIGAKWDKLSEQDLSAFKTKDDVVTRRGQVRPRKGAGTARRRRRDEGPSDLTRGDAPRPPEKGGLGDLLLRR